MPEPLARYRCDCCGGEFLLGRPTAAEIAEAREYLASMRYFWVRWGWTVSAHAARPWLRLRKRRHA